MKKTILKIIGIIAFTFLVFAVWYKFNYSMSEVKSFDMNSPELTTKILIATQGSEYKDGILSDLTTHFKSKDVYIKVIDIYELTEVDADRWSAICIIHTWEYGNPPFTVEEFTKKTIAKNQLIVHTTSGEGSYRMEEVDAITGASVMEDIPTVSTQLIERLEEVIYQ